MTALPSRRIPQHIAARVSVSLRLSADAARVQAQELRHLGREADADEADLMRQAWLALAIDVENGRLEQLAAEHTTVPTGPYAEYTAAQLDGDACIACDQDITESQPSRPVHQGPRGQLFVHSNIDDCKAAATAESEA